MKINNEDLKLLYSEYLIENAPISQKKCPSTKEILYLLRSKLSQRRKLKIINHVTNCYYCYRDFQFIFHVLREEKNLITEFDELILSRNEISPIKKDNISSFPRLSWKSVSIFLGLLLIFSTIFIFILYRNKDRRDYRSEYFPSINLIEPIGGKVQKSLLKFRWVEIKESEYYIIEIFDETLLSIWRSNKIYNNYFSPPERIVDKLEKSKRYFWVLTVYFPDGRKTESRIEHFFLSD